MLSWLPNDFKRRTKSGLKNLRIALSRKSRGFSRSDLVNLLRDLGIEPGDAVLVHSSLDSFGAFLGKPMDILAALQEAVGSRGTILMPTLPFRGSAVEYVSTPRIFDVKKTPSQMGLLTELLRRTPGAIRSVHPTHAVAAVGAQAESLAQDHHKASTPCGLNSPYHRLLGCNGKLLFLGTDISVMTFFHSVEEILESKMPFSPFTKESFSLRSRNIHGDLVATETRLFEPQYSKRRNLAKLIPLLKRQNAWRDARLGGMQATLVTAIGVLRAATELARQGIYCYD